MRLLYGGGYRSKRIYGYRFLIFVKYFIQLDTSKTLCNIKIYFLINMTLVRKNRRPLISFERSLKCAILSLVKYIGGGSL